jgi:hypothetical protein
MMSSSRGVYRATTNRIPQGFLTATNNTATNNTGTNNTSTNNTATKHAIIGLGIDPYAGLHHRFKDGLCPGAKKKLKQR